MHLHFSEQDMPFLVLTALESPEEGFMPFIYSVVVFFTKIHSLENTFKNTESSCYPMLWFRNGTPQFSVPTETLQATCCSQVAGEAQKVHITS